MHVMIAGGSGLIGKAVTRNLIENKHQVTIISRNPVQTRIGFTGGEVIGWDLEELVRYLATSDAVINLAGESIAGNNPLKMRWTPERKTHILNSRLKAGKRLTEAIQRSPEKPEVFLQSSAIGYYGNAGTYLIDETSPPGNDFLADICLAWEDSTKAVESWGVRRVILRTGLVFSKEGGLFPLLSLPYSLYLGGQLGSGQQYISWIHIEDVVKIIRFLIENPKNQGVYNLVSPNPLNNQEFSYLLGTELDKPVWLTVPAFALKLALGEAATLALDGQQVFPKRLLNTGYDFKYDQPAPALASLVNN